MYDIQKCFRCRSQYKDAPALISMELHLDFTLRAQMRVTPGTAHTIVHKDAVSILIHLMTGKHNLNSLLKFLNGSTHRMTGYVCKQVPLPLKCKADNTMLRNGKLCKDVSSASLFQRTQAKLGYWPYIPEELRKAPKRLHSSGLFPTRLYLSLFIVFNVTKQVQNLSMQIEKKIKGDKRKVHNNLSKLQVCICQMVVLYGKVAI